MKSRLFIILFLFPISAHLAFSSFSTIPKEENEDRIIIGTKTRMYSEILGEWRPLEVYLPDDYGVSDMPYPVLVVLDGGWAFNYCVSIVDMISPNYLPRMIVVGLPNTDRYRDLYPLFKWADKSINGSERFLQFMHEELFPYLGKKYRTRDYRILFGHSLGGFFSIYTLLKFPSLFEGYIATSPSLGVTENSSFLNDLLKSAAPDVFNGKYLYFSGGGEEGEELHLAIKEFDRSLTEKKNSGLQFSFDIFEGEGHVPVKGFYKGLRWIFHRWIPELEFFRNGTLDDIKNHYGKLTQRYGFSVLPPSPIMNTVGRRYLRENQPEKAIELYTYFISLYPKSAPGYLSLAEAFVMAKKIDLAIQNLRKCLEIDPENTGAQKMLEDIQK